MPKNPTRKSSGSRRDKQPEHTGMSPEEQKYLESAAEFDRYLIAGVKDRKKYLGAVAHFMGVKTDDITLGVRNEGERGQRMALFFRDERLLGKFEQRAGQQIYEKKHGRAKRG